MATGLSVGVGAAPASAAAASIVCGGVKHGSGWKTNPTGGYDAQGCGAGIDYVATPTSATSTYYFGTLPAGDVAYLEAYIPSVYASANMNWDVYLCDVRVASYVYNENNYHGKWVELGSWASNGPCDVHVTAWSGMAHAAYMGLDAVRNLG